MLPIISEEMFTNRFVETNLPTKSQIFARTGQHAVSPAGSYTGDESAPVKMSKTQNAKAVADAAESFEPLKTEVAKDDLPEF